MLAASACQSMQVLPSLSHQSQLKPWRHSTAPRLCPPGAGLPGLDCQLTCSLLPDTVAQNLQGKNEPHRRDMAGLLGALSENAHVVGNAR